MFFSRPNGYVQTAASICPGLRSLYGDMSYMIADRDIKIMHSKMKHGPWITYYIGL